MDKGRVVEQLRAGDLSHDAVRWWELAGHDPEDLGKAWAQAHHAIRIAGLVGKSWAQEAEGGVHTSMTWMSGQGLLDGLFASEPTAQPRPMRGVLRLWNLELYLVEETGTPIGRTPLVGKTLSSAREWMVQAIENEAGAPLREVPESEATPESPVAEGEPVAELSQLAHAELIRLYANTAAVLEQISWTVPGATPVRTWPHSFEMSTQVRLTPEGDASPRFIVLGLAPPGKLAPGGYWYVAPWGAAPGSLDGEWKDLPHGSWSKPENELPIAVLPIADVVSTEDPTEQHGRVAAFLAEAFNHSKSKLIGS